MKKIFAAIVLGLALTACIGPQPKPPSGIFEQIEAAEITAQALSASVVKLTCTQFSQGQCIETGKAFTPAQGKSYHDQIQSARKALRVATSIAEGGVGDCLGEVKSQAACLATVNVILAEMERRVLEAQAKAGGAK